MLLIRLCLLGLVCSGSIAFADWHKTADRLDNHLVGTWNCKQTDKVSEPLDYELVFRKIDDTHWSYLTLFEFSPLPNKPTRSNATFTYSPINDNFTKTIFDNYDAWQIAQAPGIRGDQIDFMGHAFLDGNLALSMETLIFNDDGSYTNILKFRASEDQPWEAVYNWKCSQAN